MESHSGEIGWVAELRHLLRQEFGETPQVAMLGTADQFGAPHVRCIVVRRVGDDGSIEFVTDARSPKVAHVQRQSAVELLFWFPASRVQIRLAGEARLVQDSSVCQQHWYELSPASRATFTWPPPDRPRSTSAEFAHPPPEFAPSNFAVVRINPTSVDYLSLRETPHVRWRMRVEENWHPVAINP